MRRDLERGLNPVLAVLPRYLFASALVTQLVTVVVRLPALHDIARAVQGLSVLVGLVALTVLLVDFTTAPVGSRAHRVRGLASAWTSVLVVGFTLAWYLWSEVGRVELFLIELVAFAGGAFGHWESVRQVPPDDDEDAVPPNPDGWPFRSARQPSRTG